MGVHRLLFRWAAFGYAVRLLICFVPVVLVVLRVRIFSTITHALFVISRAQTLTCSISLLSLLLDQCPFTVVSNYGCHPNSVIGPSLVLLLPFFYFPSILPAMPTCLSCLPFQICSHPAAFFFYNQFSTPKLSRILFFFSLRIVHTGSKSSSAKTASNSRSNSTLALPI